VARGGVKGASTRQSIFGRIAKHEFYRKHGEATRPESGPGKALNAQMGTRLDVLWG
jgi:hypothetical protein